MSTPMLKPTNCDGFCGFSKTTTYCFDCPALMCNECKVSMHKEDKNHDIIDFQNDVLNWNDKKLIVSILNDEHLAENVHVEVSRKKELPKPKMNEDAIGSWQCDTCTYNCNPRNARKCEMCCSFRIMDNNCEVNQDYDKKIEIFQTEMFKNLVDLDEIHANNTEIPFENIMHSFCIRLQNVKLSLLDWYQQYYPKRRSLSILNNILEDKGYTIRLNELDRYYTDMAKQENEKFLSYISDEDIRKKLSTENELIEPNDVNKRNKLPVGILNKNITEEQIWNVIFKKETLTERENRMLLTELILDSGLKIDVLRTFVNDQELRDYLKESYESKRVTLHHLKQAITDHLTINGAINFLRNACDICCSEYPMSEMFSFLTCGHEFCKSCTLEWLKETVITKYPCKWSCPYCPDEKFNSIDKNLHYFQLKRVLVADKSLLNIFEEKLLKDQLRQSPLFHWCANDKCENGFEAEGVNKIQCPTCHTYMCVACNRDWKPEHEDKTCQEFELWMLRNDPNLSNLLKNIGIECPGCGMRYALAAGGCLHFDCKACGIKFCGGCDQLFVDKCDKKNCQMTSFHGHHPRNCLYFLRDYATNELENMLKTIDYPKLQGKPEKNCQFLITTETSMADVPCNAIVYGTTGMCDKHYREYLVQFINRFQIDPADFVSADQLNLMLFQMVLPQSPKIKGENDEQFKERLKKMVKENCLFYIPKGVNEAQPQKK